MQATTITEETLRLLFGKMGTIWMFVVCALWSKDICGVDSRIKGTKKKTKLGCIFLFVSQRK